MWKQISSVLRPTRDENFISIRSHSPAEEERMESTLSPSEKLLKACAEDDVETFTQILDSGEKPLISNILSIHDILLTAARSRSFEVLRYIFGSSPLPEIDLELHQAIFDSGFEVYLEFLNAYPDMKNLDLDDIGGPIPRAVLKNDAMFLQLLLKQGFNSDCLMKLKYPPASHELQDVHQEVVNILHDYRLLLEGTNAPPAYPSSTLPPPRGSVEQQNQFLIERRLDSAIRKKLPSVIRYILSRHPEFKMQPHIYRESFEAGKEVFGVFLEYQPDLLKKHYSIGHLGQVLGVAVVTNNLEYTRFLLEKGADPNRSYSIGGASALATAIYFKVDPEIIRLLKKYGATMKGNGNLG